MDNAFYTNLSVINFADTSEEQDKIVFRNWEFGDGDYATGQAASHVYTTPGIYSVKLTIVDNDGSSSFVSAPIKIDNYITEAVSFTDVPPPSEQGKQQIFPFSVMVSAADFNTHYLDLYAQFSKSAPFKETTRWSGLQPTWRFLDTNFNPISSIQTKDTIVYYNNTTVIGVTGTAQFYYVDDMPTQDPIILWVTLRTPQYTNSEVKTNVLYTIDAIPPYMLSFDAGIDLPIHPVQWVGGNIPHLVTVRGRSINSDGTISYPILYNFPSTTSPFMSAGNLVRTIVNVNSTEYIFDNTNAQITRHSPEGYDMGGFIKSNVKINNTGQLSAITTMLSGSMDVMLEGIPPRHTPFIWIPNPDNNTISRVQYQNPNIFTVTPPTSVLNVPFLTADEAGPLDTHGYSGIYGVAIDPLFNAWITDSELDKVYKFDAKGNILHTINLAQGSTPASICLDSFLNVYIATEDGVVKADANGNILNTIVIPFSTVPALSGATPVNEQSNGPFSAELVIPTIVETDSSDNIWVGYSGPNFSALVQYSNTGIYKRHILLDPSLQPVDIVVNGGDDSFWVSLSHKVFGSGGSIAKYSTVGSQLSSVGIQDPYYITQDLNGSIWVTNGFNNVTFLSSDGVSSSITRTTINGIDYVSTIGTDITGYTNNNLERSTLGGIACDSLNRIWVLDSFDNRVHVLSAGDINQATTLKITPDSNLEFYKDTPSSSQYTSTNILNSSIQAIGDWTGVKWQQKYTSFTSGINPKTLTGTSAQFNLMPFNKNFNYDIRKFNESFDIISYLKALPMPEYLEQNTVLFDNFFQYTIGGPETTDQSVGRISYERIANFTPNHVDIDTCGVNQIYSLAEELDVPLDNYNLTFPPELRRIMDLVSISHSKLWGTRNKNTSKFRDEGSCCSDCKPINKGSQLDFYTASVSAATKIVAKSRFSDSYQAISIVPQNYLNVFPLSGLVIPELQSPLNVNYTFYTFIPIYDNKQVEGVINWDDPFTTLKETNSAINAWYGKIDSIADEGIIEQIINYTLHRGLGLID